MDIKLVGKVLTSFEVKAKAKTLRLKLVSCSCGQWLWARQRPKLWLSGLNISGQQLY